MTSKKVMSRAVVALALGTALAMSTAALAGAQGHGWGRLSSPRVSPFSFANDGTGGEGTDKLHKDPWSFGSNSTHIGRHPQGRQQERLRRQRAHCGNQPQRRKMGMVPPGAC